MVKIIQYTIQKWLYQKNARFFICVIYVMIKYWYWNKVIKINKTLTLEIIRKSMNLKIGDKTQLLKIYKSSNYKGVK